MTTYEQLLAEIERDKAQRAAEMPAVKDCLNVMLQAKQRLRELGWNDGIYAPKDGTLFEVIEFGSTGVFNCRYDGEWPDGHWMTSDGRDLYPSSSAPLMFRPKPN
jgi:hypothetical protein